MLALWALPEDYLEQYLSLRKPRLEEGVGDVAIGRALLPRTYAQKAGDARSAAGQQQTPVQVSLSKAIGLRLPEWCQLAAIFVVCC